MRSAAELDGLMRFLRREEWSTAFAQILHEHLDGCRSAGIEFDQIYEHLGAQHARALWACAFEDFLSRELPGGRNMVDEYLRQRAYKESIAAREYMKALRRSTMSLHEVSGIDPGRCFLARDLIRGGEPVRVAERTATMMMKPWERIGARIVPLQDGHQMSGGVLLFRFDVAERLLARFRERQRANGALVEPAAPVFTRIWLDDALEGVLHPRLPELVNSDGDPILFCTLRFSFLPGITSEAVRSALQAVADLVQDDDAVFEWVEDRGTPIRARAHPTTSRRVALASLSDGRTILGTVEIADRAVRFTTDSHERAERGRDRIGAALRGLVGAPSMATETAEEALARQPKKRAAKKQRPAPLPPQVEREIVHGYLDQHYRKTLDQPLAMLGDVSPRQAAATAAGRAKVVTWLKLIENGLAENRGPGDALGSYDMGWMWAELGLSDQRV